ncbi:CG17618, partial [Drosophila busckii]
SKSKMFNAQQQQQQGSIGIYNNKMNIIPNYNSGGMSSFDAESLPDFSEFDSESVTLDYYKERY